MGKNAKIESRRIARESFMQLLYEMEAQKDFSNQKRLQFLSQLELLRDYNEEEDKRPVETEYINNMFKIVTSNLSDIDKILIDSSAHWKLDRISRVDLAIIRLSVAEILYFDEIPDSVSINEAVELAKKFGSEESSKFVNGILGKVSRGKNEDKHI